MENYSRSSSYCLVASSPWLLRGSSEYAYLTRKLYYWSQHYIIGINTVNRTTPSWRIYQIVKTSPFSNCEKKNRKCWNIGAHQMLSLYVRNFRISRNTEYHRLTLPTMRQWWCPCAGNSLNPFNTFSPIRESFTKKALNLRSQIKETKVGFFFLLWNERQIYFNYCDSTAMKLFRSR